MAYGLTQSVDLERGSSQYMSRADTASLLPSTQLCLELWAKIESAPGSGEQYRFISQFQGPSNRAYTFFYLNDSGTNKLRLQLDEDGTAGTIDTFDINQTLATGTWTHVAVSWAAATGTASFYINGSSIGDVTGGVITDIHNSTAQINVGTAVAGDQTYDGLMNLFRFWTTTRSQAQIAANMCNVIGSTAGLAAEWTLDNTYNDNSGNSNTLTPVNSPTFTADVPATCALIVGGRDARLLPLLGVG